ncbi:hypothetical protein GCM10011612_02290 [Actinomyces gaoshouyii]|uniref:Uncharacterized protein n=1 Tax=Actinomyces gaoshouyii TaxID=1960083 RepID=A0A8H9HC88_9ACTO|nr:hypothetical protein GCM10011612_02290 [Actinomyces gaoshouyii]
MLKSGFGRQHAAKRPADDNRLGRIRQVDGAARPQHVAHGQQVGQRSLAGAAQAQVPTAQGPMARSKLPEDPARLHLALSHAPDCEDLQARRGDASTAREGLWGQHHLWFTALRQPAGTRTPADLAKFEDSFF